MKNISVSFLMGLFLLIMFPIYPQQNKENMMTTIIDTTSVPILTPSFKERETKKLKLQNGMQVLLIHDPSAKQSGAALSVEVGGWSDPDEYPGMAHFLEHMLFLGNTKYPEESEYHKFIDEHGGQSNAFTAYQNTTYMFSVNNNAFTDALDRFSQFFISPTFTESATDRERGAVDQEFKRLKENDGWRENFVRSHIYNQEHPISRFHVGNLETLNHISRDALIEWYHEHYSANIMHLVLYSPLSISQMEKLATEDFLPVLDTGKSVQKINEPIFAKNTAPTITYIDPIAEIRTVTLSWEIPISYTDLENKSHHILGHLLGHEGKGSLLADLKNSDLATGLSAGGSKLGKDQALFSLCIGLTKKGLEKLPMVVERCFESIAVYKSQALPKYLYNELKSIALQGYQYQSKDSAFGTATQHATGLLHEEIASYPERSSLYQSYDENKVHQLLEELSPKRVMITVAAPSKDLDVKLNKKEKWSSASYASMPISESYLKQWSHPEVTGRIIVPRQNPFIADSLSVNSSSDEKPKTLIPVPTTLEDSDYAKVYFCKDDRYHVPKIVWYFTVKTPEIKHGNAKSEVLRDLYIYALVEELKELTYPASLAGMEFEVGAVSLGGITLKISGTSPKASHLLLEIATKIKKIAPSVEQFLTYKELLLRNYENYTKQDPIHQVLRISDEYLVKDSVSPIEKAKELKDIHWKDLNKFTKNLFDKVFIEALLYGNANKDHAMLAWSHFKNQLGGKPFPEAKGLSLQILDINENKGPILINRKTSLKRSAVALIIEEGIFSFKKRAIQQILSSAIESPFFDALRTKQQTAYVVWNFPVEEERELMEYFAIESASHNTRDLLARFELVLEDFLKSIETDFSEERFENIRSALMNKLEKPPENIYAMGALLYTLAFKYDGDFKWIDKRIGGFKKANYKDFLDFAHKYYGRENRKRLAILLNGKIPKANAFNYRSVQKKSSLGSYLTKKEREETIE